MASTRTVRQVCAPVVTRLSTCRAVLRRCAARLRQPPETSCEGDHGAAMAGVEPVAESTTVGRPLSFEALTASGRFVRDSRVGGMFHRGQLSLREDAPRGSLHVSVGDGGRVSVHVDRYSPLAERRQGRRGAGSRYSVVRVVVHNLGIVANYGRLLARRRFGDHRCELICEEIEVTDEETGDQTTLLVCDSDDQPVVAHDHN